MTNDTTLLDAELAEFQRQADHVRAELDAFLAAYPPKRRSNQIKRWSYASINLAAGALNAWVGHHWFWILPSALAVLACVLWWPNLPKDPHRLGEEQRLLAVMFNWTMRRLGLQVERIALDVDNRMLRAGSGKNEGRWFFRIDLWRAGYRFTKTGR